MSVLATAFRFDSKSRAHFDASPLCDGEAFSPEIWVGGVDLAAGVAALGTSTFEVSVTFCDAGFELPLNAEVTAAIADRIAPM